MEPKQDAFASIQLASLDHWNCFVRRSDISIPDHYDLSNLPTCFTIFFFFLNFSFCFSLYTRNHSLNDASKQNFLNIFFIQEIPQLDRERCDGRIGFFLLFFLIFLSLFVYIWVCGRSRNVKFNLSNLLETAPLFIT